jgi:hypothetical protein
MEKQGILRLDLVDVYGEKLNEPVDINLRNMTVTDIRLARKVHASKKIRIPDLYGAPQGTYRIEVDSLSYRPVSQFVNLKASGITDVQMTFPVNPKKVVSINFPKYEDILPNIERALDLSANVLSFEGKRGLELYNTLDDVRKAGMLNIAAKTNATLLPNGKTVLSYIEELIELRGDRFFARVPKELREETKNSVATGLFYAVDSTLHKFADPSYSSAGSFKTNDHYGNLQLTFFMNIDGKCVADIDIDDASGLEHIFQVLRNELTGQPTNPFDIHEILLAYQKINPDYSFNLHESAPVA